MCWNCKLSKISLNSITLRYVTLCRFGTNYEIWFSRGEEDCVHLGTCSTCSKKQIWMEEACCKSISQGMKRNRSTIYFLHTEPEFLSKSIMREERGRERNRVREKVVLVTGRKLFPDLLFSCISIQVQTDDWWWLNKDV